jgi:hypothetical protein
MWQKRVLLADLGDFIESKISQIERIHLVNRNRSVVSGTLSIANKSHSLIGKTKHTKQKGRESTTCGYLGSRLATVDQRQQAVAQLREQVNKNSQDYLPRAA